MSKSKRAAIRLCRRKQWGNPLIYHTVAFYRSYTETMRVCRADHRQRMRLLAPGQAGRLRAQWGDDQCPKNLAQ